MKPLRTVVLALVCGCILGVTATLAGAEKDIPISKVPKKVLAAAEKAVPGIKFTEAEWKKTSKGIVYEVEGTADGKKYEINVTEEGKVLRVKQEGKDRKGQAKDGKDDPEDDD
jgi:hypothetical protein